MNDPTLVLVPQEIANDDSVRVVALFVADGVRVQTGDRVAEIETSKSNVEVTATGEGYVELCCAVGADIAIGGVLAKLHAAPLTSAPGSSPTELPSMPRETVVSAAAARMMQERGIDPSNLPPRTFLRTKDIEVRAPEPKTESTTPFQQTLCEDWSWLQLLKADLVRINGVDDTSEALRQCWWNPGFRYLIWFRLAQAAKKAGGLLRVVYYFALWRMNCCSYRYGIRLPISVKAGPGLNFGHWGGIWINAGCTFGANCTLGNDINIGQAGGGEGHGVPQFGDAVFIGPGARLSGAIRVGQESAIMANTVVVSDLAPHSIAIGVPHRSSGTQPHNRFINNRCHCERASSPTF